MRALVLRKIRKIVGFLSYSQVQPIIIVAGFSELGRIMVNIEVAVMYSPTLLYRVNNSQANICYNWEFVLS